MNNSGWEKGSFAAPSTVSRTQAASAFLNWLATYPYTPLDLLEPSLLDGAHLVYVPYFEFKVGYRSDYSVSIGYTSREPHTVHETVYENGRFKRVPRTVWLPKTDYDHYSSAVSGDFALATPDQEFPGIGSSSFLRDASWKADELVPSSSLAHDGPVLAFTRTLDEVFDEVVKSALKRHIESHILGKLKGDTYRHLQYAIPDHYNWSRVYLPFWHFSWEYRGERHMALVDGRHASRVTGQLPEDRNLQHSANKALTPLWLALGLAFVLALLSGSVEVPSEFQTGLFVIIGLAVAAVGFGSYQRRHQVLGDAEARRKAAVERILSSLSES